MILKTAQYNYLLSWLCYCIIHVCNQYSQKVIMTVYIVCEPTDTIAGMQRSKLDMTPAREYGELVILLPSSQSLLSTVPTVRTLKEKLRNFTDNDYILPVGDPVLMSTVAVIAAEQNGGKVKFLKWDKPTRRYFSIQIDTSGRAT